MDILGVIGDIFNAGHIISWFASNPVEAAKELALAGAGTVIALVVGGAVFKYVDDAILWLDNKIIDKIPVKVVKDYFQNLLIKRLEKRVVRYQELIKEIKD